MCSWSCPDLSYTVNPPNDLCEWNQYYATVEGAYLLAIPIRCILGTGVSSVTFSIAGTEGLTDEPVGFDYLRLVRDDNGTSGATCVCYDDNSAGLQDTVTITSSVNPYTNGFFDIPATTSGTGSAACWCLFVGTGSGEPVSSGSITYLVEYTDPVTNETVSETKTLTFGLPPSMTVEDGASMGSVWNGMGVGTIPVTGDAYVVSFSDLDSNTTYKVLCTEGVELSFDDGKYPVANEDTIDGSSIESFGSVGTITVEANTSTESRNIVVALVPENNGTVEDISNYDYFNECSDTDSGASKNGYYYSYVYATQDGKEEVTQKTNTINVTYNPRSLVPYDNAAVGAGVQVEYDVTASATYPVSSSVVLNEVIEDVTATDCSGSPAANPGVRTLSVGSSILKTGSSAQSFDLGWDITATPVNPGNNTFGYDNFIASPTKFGDISVSLSRPESDSYYKYQVGTVTVNAVPSLGVGKLILDEHTLNNTGSFSSTISLGDGASVPGLSVSCSDSSFTCSIFKNSVLVSHYSSSFNPILGYSGTLYLKRGNNILSQRNITTSKAGLTLNPSSLYFDSAASTSTVMLQDPNLLYISADSYNASDIWISVIEDTDTTGKYGVSVKKNTSTAVRTGTVTFKLAGYSDVVLNVSQAGTGSSSSNLLEVYFQPNESSVGEESVGGNSISLLLNNSSSTGSLYQEWKFRYSKPAGSKPFKPVLTDTAGETGIVNWTVNPSSYISDDEGTFYIRHIGSVTTTTAVPIGSLDFSTSGSGTTYGVPATTILSSNINS